jgi:hypothetical protein
VLLGFPSPFFFLFELAVGNGAGKLLQWKWRRQAFTVLEMAQKWGQRGKGKWRRNGGKGAKGNGAEKWGKIKGWSKGKRAKG